MEIALIVVLVVLVVVMSQRDRDSTESNNPVGWSLQHSPGMSDPPTVGESGTTFQFPTSDGVHYLVKSPAFQAATSLVASGSVVTTGEPTFNFRTNPNNQGTTPSNFRLYFQRRGDNLSGSGEYQYYRWWRKRGVTLAPGDFQTDGDLLNPGDWSSVFGVSGDASPEAIAAFQAATQNIGVVGLTFGGGSFYGHGVFVDPGTGTATFRLDRFEVK